MSKKIRHKEFRYPSTNTFPCLRRTVRGDIVLVSQPDADRNHHLTFLDTRVPNPEEIIGRSFTVREADLNIKFFPLPVGYSLQIENAE